MEEEVVQNSEEIEIATQEDVQDDSTHEEQQPETEAKAQRAEEQDRNWENMRQRQREQDLEIKHKDEMIAMLNAQQVQPVQPVEKEEPIDPESYANYEGVQKITNKTLAPLEKQVADLQNLIKQQEQEKAMRDFKAQFPDFDDVVNVDTLELLEKKNPRLAASIANTKDPLQMGLQSYEYIKATGLAKEVPNARRVKEIDQKIEQNKKTVQSPQAYDKRPMAKVMKTSQADQKRLYEEMMGFAKQA